MPPRRSRRIDDANPQPKEWLRVAQDPAQPEATRLSAINLINDRVAYYKNVYLILTDYLSAKNISYSQSHSYTATTFANSVYDALLHSKPTGKVPPS